MSATPTSAGEREAAQPYIKLPLSPRQQGVEGQDKTRGRATVSPASYSEGHFWTAPWLPPSRLAAGILDAQSTTLGTKIETGKQS